VETGVALTGVELVVHDPAGFPGLPGNTQMLGIYAGTHEHDANSDSLYLVSFRCDSYDPAASPEAQGCLRVGDDFRALSDVRFSWPDKDVLRLRATTSELGDLDVSFAGRDRYEYVSRQWRSAEGRQRVSGTTTTVFYVHSVATGTLGGRRLDQPAELGDTWSSVTTTRTVQQTSTGTPVPIPVIPQPGTGTNDRYTQGIATAMWAKRLGRAVGAPADTVDVEVGEVSVVKGGPGGSDDGSAGLSLTTQRCGPGDQPRPAGDRTRPGTCDVVEYHPVGLADAVYDIDRAGSATLTGTAILADETRVPLSANWRGNRPIGVRNLETTRFDEVSSPVTWAITGVRWPSPTARITYGTVREHVHSSTLSNLLHVRQ
jgi:hypothetical protein